MLSPLLANIYLHQLDVYMAQYAHLHKYERARRRKRGQGNFIYVRYADDFVVMCNGPKAEAEAMKEELYQFLKSTLKLKLSKEKTKVTHVNDGFEFLGFRIKRTVGSAGRMVTKVTIPQGAITTLCHKLRAMTSKGSHHDSVSLKIRALNRVIKGWCHYYQYTGEATTQFKRIESVAFWSLAHWLGRKYKISMPQVMRRFHRPSAKGIKVLGTETHTLMKATSIKTKRYLKSHRKPNPYTTQEIELERERLPRDTPWIGVEERPGWADLRLQVMARDAYMCQHCGGVVTPKTGQVDHKRRLSKFKRPVDANRLANLQTLCIVCHKAKTKQEWQMESPLR